MMVKIHQFAIASLNFGFPIAAVIAVLAFVCTGAAQTASVNRVDPVNQLVEHVMQNESRADTNDHSHWVYRDQKRTPETNTVKIVVETAAGDVAKTIEMAGRALTAEERRQDDKDMEELVNSPDRQQKARRASEHDDQQAHAFMQVLPVAFIWTEASRNDSTATLNFKPNPQFQPPSRELRVLGAMSGEMVVDLKEVRVISLSGHLTAPVDFGWGLLGKLEKGGTFHIERREIAPGEWQTTETHVHIKGKALFFKSISEQEDEETSGYKPTPPSLTLSQAAEMLEKGTIQPGL
jgi:mannose-6-phosphate isomerase-like protein (cupin superfamily)